MRIIFTLLVFPCLVFGDDDAEKRVRTMEKKLSDAKSLQVTFDISAEGLRESGTFKGTLSMAEGNKMHLDGTIEMGKKRVDWRMVSDGTQLKEEGLEKDTRPTPNSLRENQLNILTHGGYIMGWFLASSSDGKESILKFKASEFKLDRTEKIGTREAKVIICKLTPEEKIGKEEVSFSETLWLDSETNLPLRRVVTGKFGRDDGRFTENYSKFALDPKLDAKLFELPK